MKRSPLRPVRSRGATMVGVMLFVVALSVFSAGLSVMVADLMAVQATSLASAQALYSAESGMAVANKTQAATAGPVSFENATWETIKAGDTYTTTVTAGGQTNRVLTGTLTPPAGGGEENPGGPLDEQAAINTATTGAYYDVTGPGWVDGDDGDQIVMRLINPTDNDLRAVAFAVSSTGTQPQVKALRFRTAANGWQEETVWRHPPGVDVPTGRLDFDEGDPEDDWTVPANSYIIVEELEFKQDVDPEELITVTFYFLDGSQSDIAFKMLNDLNVPAEPLDEATSQSSAVNDGGINDNPRPPGAGYIFAGDDEIILRLVNETNVNLTIYSFSLSCTTSQPKLDELELATPGNKWDNGARVWHQGSGRSLPTGELVLDDGDPVQDYVIPAGGYILVNDMIFKDDVNPGTFTLVINFRGGASSTLVFTIP